jgi:hypothetical protein
MKTTLRRILDWSPCGQEPGSDEGWDKLLRYLGKTEADDEPLPLLTILESNGLVDALWALRAVDGHEEEIRALVCDCALRVRHLWEMPEIVRQYLETRGVSLKMEASDAAGRAVRAAQLAAARDAGSTVWRAAAGLAGGAAEEEAWCAAAAAAASGAAHAEHEWQKQRFIQMCEGAS